MEILNVDILRRPSNWLTVATMVIIALFGAHFILALMHGGFGALTDFSEKPAGKIV